MNVLETLETDILIVGGGLAGLTAACAIADSSSLRLLVTSTGAGASPWVHGFSAPVSPGDSPEQFFQDVLKSGYGQNDPALARALCQGALGALRNAESLGVAFDKGADGQYALLRPLGASFPRVVCAGNETGPAILRRLDEKLRGNGHAQRERTLRVVRLCVKEGAVRGALGYDLEKGQFRLIAARAVILACGGFCRLYPFSTNKRDGGGDGIAMAYEAGAELCDMEFIQFEPSGAVWPQKLIGTSVITTMYHDGAVMRNALGERFMLRYGEAGERVDKDVQARRMAQEILEGRGTEHGGVYFDATGVGREKLETSYPMYVKRYKDVGIDLAQEMIQIAPAPHTSLGGVAAKPDCSTAVKGLFACGEVLGGLHGANRIGGNAGLQTLVFGKIAGESARAYALGQGAPGAAGPEEARGLLSEGTAGQGAPGAMDLGAMRQEMGKALQEGAYVLRDGRRLAKARQRLKELLAHAGTAPTGESPLHCYERLRLKNDLTAALLLVTAALERKESVGCHIREDCPGRETERYRILLSRTDHGPKIRKAALPEIGSEVQP